MGTTALQAKIRLQGSEKISMIKKIITATIAGGGFILSPLKVLAQNVNSTIEGLNQTAHGVKAFSAQAADNGRSYVFSDFMATQAGRIIGLALSFIGVLFLILMIYAGITWMTAQGNEQQVAKAKSLMVNAVIGIIIVAGAYALVAFVGDEIIK